MRAKTIVWIIAILAVPLCALGHRLSVFGWVEGDTAFVTGKFMGGGKPRNCDIEVKDKEGNLLVTGKTDENGDFSFPVPEKTDLIITIDAGMGHMGSWTIPEEELSGVGGQALPQNTPDKSLVRKSRDAQDTDKRQKDSIPAEEITKEDIRKIVSKTIQKEMRPVVRMIREEKSNQGISITDIFGGIGYIFGLMGVAVYFYHRKLPGK